MTLYQLQRELSGGSRKSSGGSVKGSKRLLPRPSEGQGERIISAESGKKMKTTMVHSANFTTVQIPMPVVEAVQEEERLVCIYSDCLALLSLGKEPCFIWVEMA